MTKDDGGPAFPADGIADGPTVLHRPSMGMTLRDWFAGQCLAGFFTDRGAGFLPTKDLGTFAACAYEMADAMLAARAKEPTR